MFEAVLYVETLSAAAMRLMVVEKKRGEKWSPRIGNVRYQRPHPLRRMFIDGATGPPER